MVSVAEHDPWTEAAGIPSTARQVLRRGSSDPANLCEIYMMA